MNEEMVARWNPQSPADAGQALAQVTTFLQKTARGNRPESALHELVAMIAGAAGADRCSLLMPLGRSALRVVASSDQTDVGDLIISLDRYPELAEAIANKEPLLVENVRNNPMLRPTLHLLERIGLVSIAAAPVPMDHVSALLRLQTTTRSLSPDDVVLLQAVAAEVGAWAADHTQREERSAWRRLAVEMADVVLEVAANGTIIAAIGDLPEADPRLMVDLEGAKLSDVIQPLRGRQNGGFVETLLGGDAQNGGSRFTLARRWGGPATVSAWSSGPTGITDTVWIAIRLGAWPSVRAALDAVPTPLLGVDSSDGSICEVNRAACGLFGADRRAMLDRTIHDLLDLHAEYPVVTSSSGAETLVRAMHEQGSHAPEEPTLIALVDDRPTADRKAIENRLRSALEMQLQEINELRAQLDELEVLRTRFLSASAHELKTPLTVIQSYLETLITDLTEGLSEEQLSFLRIAYQSVLRLRRLVIDLVDLAALTSGKMRLEIGRVSLDKIVGDVLEEMSSIAVRAGVNLRCGDLSRLSHVRADPLRLQQVVRNLLDNAIKFTPTRGFVNVGGMISGDSVVLSVADTGVGIPEERRTEIFDEFFQARTPPDRMRRGSGLGLAITRRIIRSLGGRIELQSAVGEGSVFSIYLPQWPEDDNAATAAEAPPTDPASTPA